MDTGYHNLGTIDRSSRAALGFLLVGIAYFGSGFLGLMALLPIVAIFPLMTATLGYCPVEAFVFHRTHLRTHAVNIAHHHPA